MSVHWECAWCQFQILVLPPAYPTLHKYAHIPSETSCVSTGNVCGASEKFWQQHQHIQQYTYTSQHLRNFMCVHWECAWCQCQKFVLAPAYPTLHKYTHRTLETSCVSTGNVCGASAKYWYYHQHIQRYTNTPTNLRKLHVCPLGMCVVLMPNIGISTSISKTTQYTPTDLRKLHVCPLGMCVVLVPNIGISTSISNTTQIRPQIFRNIMCVHWECAWCQCQILVLAPAYPTLHIYVTAFEKLHVCSFPQFKISSYAYELF